MQSKQVNYNTRKKIQFIKQYKLRSEIGKSWKSWSTEIKIVINVWILKINIEWW